MLVAANLLIAIVVFLQLYFLILEMFLWRTPRVRRAFGMTPELAEQTSVLAKNQGLYNGFLAAGLFWGLVVPDPAVSFQFKSYFLGCVFLAGIYGGITASRRIIFVQAMPALLAFIFHGLAR